MPSRDRCYTTTCRLNVSMPSGNRFLHVTAILGSSFRQKHEAPVQNKFLLPGRAQRARLLRSGMKSTDRKCAFDLTLSERMPINSGLAAAGRGESKGSQAED